MEKDIEDKFSSLEQAIAYQRELDRINTDLNRRIDEITNNVDVLVNERLEKLKPKAISILGETLIIPANKWTFGIFGLILVAMLIAFSAAIYLPEDRIRVITASAYKFTNGTVQKDETKNVSQILKIVTPHELTLSDLENLGYPLNEKQKEYYSTTKEALDKFGEDLKKTLGAQGYTKWEGFGTATSPEKRQWVWNVTWAEGKAIDPALVVQAYKNRFKRDSGIYIEEFRVGKTIYKASNK